VDFSGRIRQQSSIRRIPKAAAADTIAPATDRDNFTGRGWHVDGDV
jgi:hypothetical protein